jgi:hypothetical protein
LVADVVVNGIRFLEQFQMSPDQNRFIQLTKEIGLSFDEAVHALGRRTGGLREFKRMSRQEQSLKAQEYVDSGLTEIEAKRVVGIGKYISPIRLKRTPTNSKSLDWMPAVKAYQNMPPGSGRKGLLK